MKINKICQEIMTALIIWRDATGTCDAEIISLTILINVLRHSQENG